MKRIICLLLLLAVTFSGIVYADRRVEQGLHIPAPAADFSDAFNGDLSNWSVEIANGANWQTVAGEAGGFLTSGPVDTWNAEQETVIVFNEEIPSDNYSVRVSAADKRYGAMASLVFKYTAPDKYYSLRMLNIENVDYIGFYRRNGVTLWQEEILTQVEFPGGTRTPEKAFEIRVDVSGHTFRAYVDGNLVTEYTEDKEYFEGNRAGIFQSYGDPSYDDFEIYLQDEEAPSAGDEDFQYNRRLLHALGFLWDSSETGDADALLTKAQLSYFMSKLCFAPAEEASHEYATTENVTDAFLKALGYDKISPSSAYYTAWDDLLDGVEVADEGVTLRAFMQIAVNSFDIDVVKRIYGKNENYKIGKELNLLNVYHDIYFDTSVLTDNGRTTLTGISRLSRGQVGFENGFVAHAGSTGADKYIGYNMEYYYRDGETPELLFFRMMPDDELFLYADEIVSYKNNTLSYKLRNTEKVLKKKLPANISCIYNGMGVSSIRDYMFTPTTGDVTIIDNGGTFVAVVMDYTDIIVERVSASERKIFDEFSDKAFSWDKASYADFYTGTYRALTPADIYVGDVVSVAESLNGKYITFMVSRDTVSGTVEAVDADKNYAVINGEKYYLSDEFLDTTFITAGDKGSLCLNIDGIGVTFRHEEAADFTVAYMIDSDSFDGLDSRVKIQLFDGELKVLPCASTIKINDTVYRKNTAASVIGSYRDIFEYKLNADGEISHLSFPEGNTNGGRLVKMGGYVGGTYYKSDTRSFSGFMLADEKVKVFLVPLDRSRTDAYELADISYFRNDVMYYSLSGYSRSDNVETAEYIVSEFDTYPQYQLEPACILEKVTDVLTDDGESSVMITVRFDGADVRQVIMADYCSLEGAESGDVIQYSVNNDGKVHSVLPVFDRSDKRLNHYGDAYYTASYRMVYGTVRDLRKSSFIFGRAGGGEEIVTLGCPIVVYDSASRGEKTRAGSVDDIMDYAHFGADADEMLIRFEYGIPREMIIYR